MKAATGFLEINGPPIPFAKYRAYSVFVDNQKVGAVRDSTVLTVPLKPGHHVIWSKIGWEKSNSIKFKIIEGKTSKVQIRFKRKEKRNFCIRLVVSYFVVAVGAVVGIPFIMGLGIIWIFTLQRRDLYLYRERRTTNP